MEKTFKGEPINGDWEGKDFISISQVNRNDLDELYQEAEAAREIRESRLPVKVFNDQYQLANVYFEASTRTSSSHAAGWKRLGGGVETINNVSFSSVAKGESLKHTMQTLERYSEALVLRHNMVGAAALAASVLKAPVINAGDGIGEHPTQAVLDGKTIEKELGGIDGKVIAMAGDLLHGRTIHSLVELLSLYNPEKIYLVAPADYQIPQKYIDLLKSKNIPLVLCDDLAAVLPDVDALYMVRLQRERISETSNLTIEDQVAKKVKKVLDYGSSKQKEDLGPDFDLALDRLFNILNNSIDEKERDYAKFLLYAINGTLPDVKILNNANGFNDNIYVLTPKLMDLMKDNSAVLHPLPIAGEIEDKVDDDPRAVYMNQVENGMYIRQAIFAKLMGKSIIESLAEYKNGQIARNS
jgi:aspartate carbamoyltransferase catalytic subunit